MDARVNYVILPVAKRVMKPEQASRVITLPLQN
jgi:hypothetical protein